MHVSLLSVLQFISSSYYYFVFAKTPKVAWLASVAQGRRVGDYKCRLPDPTNPNPTANLLLNFQIFKRHLAGPLTLHFGNGQIQVFRLFSRLHRRPFYSNPDGIFKA